ncbi:LysR family transcriptional regulator [Sphingomonas sp.]|uniref:LysR family transcriptional regulator n=1 Tax=Sphingomonas sp. TaxID=28214 RepID=UPI0025F7FA31|nr:LysR family transcriptional regulator [Sphingomonas sp.]MBV9526795.1 LysR family transcriptional regulator [Sphingomonas sp.]
MLTTDRFDLLRLFVRITETGQISEAARSLGMSQPSASRLLKRLEELTAAQLVERSPHGLALTAAGRHFLGSARALLNDWHRAVDALKVDNDAISGHIRIAAPIAVGQGFLAEIVARFLNRHPDIRIDWELRDDAVDVASAGYDLWIRVGEIHRDDLIVREIYRVERALVATPDFSPAEHPRELQSARAVRLRTFVPGAIELVNDAGEAYVLRQAAVFTTDNLYAARTAVLAGVGYGALPLWCIQPELRRGDIVQVVAKWRPRPVTLSLANTPSSNRSARIKALVNHIRAELSSDAGLGIVFLREVGALASVARLGTGGAG